MMRGKKARSQTTKRIKCERTRRGQGTKKESASGKNNGRKTDFQTLKEGGRLNPGVENVAKPDEMGRKFPLRGADDISQWEPRKAEGQRGPMEKSSGTTCTGKVRLPGINTPQTGKSKERTKGHEAAISA